MLFARLCQNSKIRMVGNNNISLDIAKKSIKNMKVGTRILVKLSEISIHDAITCEFYI